MKPYFEDEKAGIRIFLGDNREILPELGRYDLCLTDPPYGIAFASNYTCDTTFAEWMNTEIANDGDTSLRDEILAQFTEWCAFGSIKTPPPANTRGTLIWDKGPASGMGDLSFPWKLSWELIFVSGTGWGGRRDEGIIKGHHIVTRKSMGRVHPNEKPVGLLVYLLKKHSARTVVDPFMGSGTTLRACKDLGLACDGIEISEKYAEIAANRLRQSVFEFA